MPGHEVLNPLWIHHILSAVRVIVTLLLYWMI